MTFTFHPRGLLVTAAFLGGFVALLTLAADVERGVAVAGVLSVVAYLLVDLLIVFNPALWWRERRNGHN